MSLSTDKILRMKHADGLRFWRFVDRKPSDDLCWEWTGHISKGGYGGFHIGGGCVPAHRVAFYLHYRKLDDAHYICHRCDNRKCCNPHHLFYGTAKSNMEDASRKKRIRTTPQYYSGKLTPKDVEEIKSLLGRGYTHEKISKMYDISTAMVSYIRNDKVFTRRR